MKKITFLAIMTIAAFVSCSQEAKGNDEWLTNYPLTAFSVQVGTASHAGVIDQYNHRVEIGSVVDLAAITGVDYTLGSETATIWPDPSEFIGKWDKSQTVVVNDHGREAAYDIIFVLYDEPAAGGKPGDGGSDEPEQNGEVIFFDDFSEGETPDENVWQLCTQANVAWAQHFDNAAGYRNAKIENGILVLTADNDGRYRNGGIRTKTGFPINTLVEVRAQFKRCGGGFPAIWQMPVNGLAWPRSGEIDIMEWVQGTPNDLYHTIHTFGTTEKPDKSSGSTSVCYNTETWHTYAASRTAEAVIIYIDGREVYRYENKHLAGEDGLIQYPFTDWEYDIILNYSLGGPLNGAMTWPGPIAGYDLPASMYVDWVKVTKLPDAE